MNLTAHPYAVLAELSWKQDNLAGANRARGTSARATGATTRTRGPWHRLAGRLTARRPRHTPRPV
ncbi:hypothetical protein GCM10025782_32360 [Pedococcus ginsenosidimutans]|jgi:hypothetical protein|uniref:Uncharacterized protein n=1 Tax=Pedococcus ginsenosidimutans TaxID=490570 RepID=A0ABP8YL25_9MICO